MHHQTRRSIEIRLEEAVTGSVPHHEAGATVAERPWAEATMLVRLEPPNPARRTESALPDR